MERPVFSGIDFTFPLLSFEKALQVLRILDFERVDVTLTPGSDSRQLMTAAELSEPEENGTQLREMLARYGFTQTDLFVFVGDNVAAALNHPDAAVRDYSAETFKRAVVYAKACGCPHITILPGAVFNGDYKASMRVASEELKRRVDCAARAGITLGIEAHIGSVVDTPAKVAELLACTDGLTLTLDYSHFIRNGAAQSEIDGLIPHASHMHFRGAAKGRLQTIFTESEIDWARVVWLLKKRDYKGGLTIEFCSCEWESQNRVDTVGETIRLREHFVELWGI